MICLRQDGLVGLVNVLLSRKLVSLMLSSEEVSHVKSRPDDVLLPVSSALVEDANDQACQDDSDDDFDHDEAEADVPGGVQGAIFVLLPLISVEDGFNFVLAGGRFAYIVHYIVNHPGNVFGGEVPKDFGDVEPPHKGWNLSGYGALLRAE